MVTIDVATSEEDATLLGSVCSYPLVQEIVYTRVYVRGDRDRARIAPTAALVNTPLNTNSGSIEIGDYTFTGHNVSIITGTHQSELLLEERMKGSPRSGRDIVVGKGVWICANALILGPCKIGDHAVIAAGSVVLAGTEVPSGAIVGGVPAKIIKFIDGFEQADGQQVSPPPETNAKVTHTDANQERGASPPHNSAT